MTPAELLVLRLTLFSSLWSAEDVREVLEVRKLPQSTDLPEEVSAVTAGRLPGVRGSHAVAPRQDGRQAVAVQLGVHQPAPPGADALPLCCPSLDRPL